MVLIVINKNLLKPYGWLLKQIYELVLKLFYIAPIGNKRFLCLSGIAINKKGQLEIAVYTNEKLIVDFDALK